MGLFDNMFKTSRIMRDVDRQIKSNCREIDLILKSEQEKEVRNAKTPEEKQKKQAVLDETNNRLKKSDPYKFHW